MDDVIDLETKAEYSMSAALPLPLLYANCVNGVFVPAACGETVDVVNPANNTIVGRVPRSKTEDVDAGELVAVHTCCANTPPFCIG
jgi:hypothetical protein